jgi:hypothetical protein
MLMPIILLLLLFSGGALVRGAARLAGGMLFCLLGLLFLLCAFSTILLKLAMIAIIILVLGVALIVALIILARTPRTPPLLSLFVIVPLLGAGLLLSGCSAGAPSTSGGAMATPAALSADIDLITSFQNKACVPRKVLVAVDQTGSRDWYGVVSLTPAQLELILEHLSGACGGEIALAAIRDESNLPFRRCDFSAAPAIGPLPDKPPSPGNIFEVKRQRIAYEKAVASTAQELRTWQVQAATERAECAEKLNKVLGPAPLAHRTDVGGILNRGRLYFSEDDGAAAPIRKQFLMLSDGIDNMHREAPPTLGPSVELVLVNSAGSVGALAAYDPKRFESTDAALKYLFRPDGREQ